MSKLLDIIAAWEPIGQGVFLLFVLSIVAGLVGTLARWIVVLVRGREPLRPVQVGPPRSEIDRIMDMIEAGEMDAAKASHASTQSGKPKRSARSNHDF